MKRFEAFYKNEEKNGHLMDGDSVYATEVRFDIIAQDEDRAMELINEEGEDSDDFILEETTGVKDQMGRFFPERIRDARI